MNLKKGVVSLALSLGSWAVQADPTHVTIEQKDGSKMNFLLAEKPVFTFDNGNLVAKGDSTTSFAFNNVENVYFSSPWANLEVVAANELRIEHLDGTAIKIQNANAEASVSLWDAYGKIFLSTKTDSEGTAVVALPQSKGVFILYVADKSFKIIRK